MTFAISCPGVLYPGVASTHWRRVGEGEVAFVPVLSIIELTFKPGVDIRDTGQPAAGLWAAVLQFLRTLPGWTSFYYGHIAAAPEHILLLIHWESAPAWQRFQDSLGCTLIYGLFATSPFNQSLQLPAAELGDSGRVLEVISFVFEAQLPEAAMRTFNDAWKDREREAKLKVDIKVHGQWLEPNVPIVVGPTDESLARAASQPVVFIGLISWGPGDYDSKIFGQTGFPAADHFMTRLPREGLLSVSQMAAVLSRQLPAKQDILAVPTSTATSTATLLQVAPLRQYREDSGLWKNLDLAVSHSIAAARSGQRLFPEPYGGYTAMGYMNEDQTSDLQHPDSPLKRMWSHTRYVTAVEVLWLYFNVGAESTKAVADGLLELQIQIAETGHCTTVRFARIENQPGAVVMLVVWNNLSAQLAALSEYQTLTEQFIASFQPLMTQPPETSNFPYGRYSFLGEKLLELTTFEIPNNQISKQLFEEAYFHFHETTLLQYMPAGCPKACSSFFGGWSTTTSTTTETKYFTAVISWMSNAARYEWYETFARIAFNYYERLGHKIDALREILDSGGKVESRFILLEPEEDQVGKLISKLRQEQALSPYG